MSFGASPFNQREPTLSELEMQVQQAMGTGGTGRAPDQQTIASFAREIQRLAQNLIQSGLQQHEAYDQATREVLTSLA